MNSVRPTAAETAPLVLALCERVARDVGVRGLAIKGPAVAMQGLRAPRVSADVDVLVHPDELSCFLDGLRAAGWRTAVPDTSIRILPLHSVNVLNDNWPLSIDVHHYFPGFLAPAAEVFEILWARRTSVELAGVPVTVCDPVSHVAVVGLHLLRDDPEGLGPSVHDLVQRALDQLGEGDALELLELARQTDCVVPLRPVLRGLGLAAAASMESSHPDELLAWFERGYWTPGTSWGRQLRLLPLRRWPGALWHAVTLTDAEIAVYHGGGETRRGRAMARLRRLGKLPKLLPGILRGLMGRPLGRTGRR